MFYESKGTGTALYEANVAAGTITRDQLSRRGDQRHVNDEGRLGICVRHVSQNATRRPRLCVDQAGDETLTQISRANAELAKMPVGKTEVIKWKSKDGREIEGLLTYPVGYVAGTKVPLILNIHGGPAGVFQQSYHRRPRRLSDRDVRLARLCDPAAESARLERLRNRISPGEYQGLGRGRLRGPDDRRR